jgi:hypothetical protein
VQIAEPIEQQALAAPILHLPAMRDALAEDLEVGVVGLGAAAPADALEEPRFAAARLLRLRLSLRLLHAARDLFLRPQRAERARGVQGGRGGAAREAQGGRDGGGADSVRHRKRGHAGRPRTGQLSTAQVGYRLNGAALDKASFTGRDRRCASFPPARRRGGSGDAPQGAGRRRMVRQARSAPWLTSVIERDAVEVDRPEAGTVSDVLAISERLASLPFDLATAIAAARRWPTLCAVDRPNDPPAEARRMRRARRIRRRHCFAAVGASAGGSGSGTRFFTAGIVRR